MFWRRFLLISAAAVCGAVSPIGAQVTTIPATITRTYVFPPVGLGASETASITVMNAATSDATSTLSAPSCTGTISFFNTNGAIGTATPFTVGSDQFKAVALPFASAGLSGSNLANGNRGEIQGRVSVTISTSTNAPCSLMLSMEIFDSATGVTHAVLSNPMFNPEPVGPICASRGCTTH